jgi:hypothetical protein
MAPTCCNVSKLRGRLKIALVFFFSDVQSEESS